MHLQIRVTPNASVEKIEQIILSDGTEIYKVYVTTSAVEGKANKAVIALLAKTFKVAKSKIVIKQGLRSRNKVVEIEGRGI
jgi:uncharacterized protein (TIGR00251 family)